MEEDTIDIYEFLRIHPDFEKEYADKDIVMLIRGCISGEVYKISCYITEIYFNMISYKHYKDYDQYMLREQSLQKLDYILYILEDNKDIIDRYMNISEEISNERSNTGDKEISSLDFTKENIDKFFRKYDRGGAY